MGGSKWSELVPELLQAIRSRVLRNSDVDYIRFGTVCKSWESVIVEKPRCLPPQNPLIMISSKPNIKTYSSCFYSLDSKNHYRREPSTVMIVKKYPRCERKIGGNQNYIGYGHGWMVNEAHKIASLVNPITGDKIHLPLLTRLVIDRAKLSSHLTLMRDNCVVMTLVINYSYEQTLAFCKPGDNKWTVMEDVEDCDDLTYRNDPIILLEFF
ncbi:hypothetical protein GIB67_026753 [Kingdonia uniflora]|uniref:KIB1-4 beta-propeller domain-containing protein n=1 Tax=Kingdonia uniflora TaxID=39325 RepID=A0A7J7MHF5_9MAGN|nr:hypothetical protein GIB67_026753 [Kingdonia uniflora]